MSDTTDKLGEQQAQEAWEKVLRGEWVEDSEIDSENRHSANAARSFLLWEQAMQSPEAVNEIEKQRAWKRLESEILPTQAKKKPALPKWWMSVAASLMLAVLLMPIWQSYQQDDEPSVLNEDGSVLIEKGE